MSNTSKSLGSYRDVEPFLKRAVKGTLTMEFASPKDALQFVARANRYRKLYREEQEKKGMAYESPYDFLMLRHPIDSVTKKRGKVVVIESRTTSVTVRDEYGREVTVDPVVDDYSDFLKEVEEKAHGPIGLHRTED